MDTPKIRGDLWFCSPLSHIHFDLFLRFACEFVSPCVMFTPCQLCVLAFAKQMPRTSGIHNRSEKQRKSNKTKQAAVSLNKKITACMKHAMKDSDERAEDFKKAFGLSQPRVRLGEEEPRCLSFKGRRTMVS